MFGVTSDMSGEIGFYQAAACAKTTERNVGDSMAFNKYVTDSMNPLNKVDIWNSDTTVEGYYVPVIIIAKDGQNVSTAQNAVSKITHKEFKCTQCSLNAKKLVKCFGVKGPILCSHGHSDVEGTHTSKKLYGISKNLYDSIIRDPEKFTLAVATDEIVAKDKFNFVNPNNTTGIEEGKTFLHYAGNCDTISDGTSKKVKQAMLMRDNACRKYWILMHNLLVKITSEWGYPGKRSTTRQRIRTILELCKEVPYAEDHFGFTLRWILKILNMFAIPFDKLSMNERIRIVVSAICSGTMNYDGNGSKSVVHFQYAQMNGTIYMWMTSATSRPALKSMMSELCKPSVKGRRDPNKHVSVQQINQAEKALGDFTNVIATTKSLAEYYKDYKGQKCFWQSPAIMSEAQGAFATMRKHATKKKDKHTVPVWEEKKRVDFRWSIPDIIEALEAGEEIYLNQEYENCIIAHTTISHEYLIHKPVPEKGGLMWSFLGNSEGFRDKLGSNWYLGKKYKLLAVHFIKAGAFMNYVFITTNSNMLPSHIKNNPVMLEACLSSIGTRHFGSIVAKLRKTTHISIPTTVNQTSNDNAMIGIGACRSPDGCLVGGDIPFTIYRDHQVYTGSMIIFI